MLPHLKIIQPILPINHTLKITIAMGLFILAMWIGGITIGAMPQSEWQLVLHSEFQRFGSIALVCECQYPAKPKSLGHVPIKQIWWLNALM
jgi:hypothetical protein